MKKFRSIFFLLSMAVFFSVACDSDSIITINNDNSRIADHLKVEYLKKGLIPESAVINAKSDLKIGYGHTSHGSQITDALSALPAFANSGNLSGKYTSDMLIVTTDGASGSLHLFQGSGYSPGYLELDAGYNDIYDQTVVFLSAPSHSEFNVIMWSWCGQLSGWSADQLQVNYLDVMSLLETEYPHVTFIYMTGHLDGTGISGNLHKRNEQIRKFCIDNNKWLFDFADIESYDPDKNYYLDKLATDECYYDSNGDGVVNVGSGDKNWAIEWQNTHTQGVDWYNCGSAHSQPVNANMKAYAAWWLFSRIAGWNGKLSK